MKSMTSYFKISLGVVRDDIRRFWAVPVIGSIFYFLGTVFVLLINLEELGIEGYMSEFIEYVLSGGYILNTINIFWISVLSVLLVFRYMHSSGHVTAVHSQPITRSTLLNSHTLSCVIFIAVPIIVTGLILLVIARPVYHYSYYTKTLVGENIFARVNILLWMLQSFVTGLFIVMIAIVSGMVTGTPFHHAVTALGFNFITPICVVMSESYFERYLFGYTRPDGLSEALTYMSTAMRSVACGYFALGTYIHFIALIIVLYILALVLYKKRKLERATDGIVYTAMEWIIEMIFGYLGMTTLGTLFRWISDESEGMTILGYAVGATLAITIVRMIIKKTVKVFDKKLAVILGCFFVVGCVFVSTLVFDLTGYESRVYSRADSITADIRLISRDDDRLKGDTYTSDEGKQMAIALHQLIVAHKDKCLGAEERYYTYEDAERVVTVTFDYYGSDDSHAILSRRYTVPVSLLLDSTQMQQLVECTESRENMIARLPNLDGVKYVNLVREQTYDPNIDIDVYEDGQIKGLYEALKNDYNQTSYESIKSEYESGEMVERQIKIVYNRGELPEDIRYIASYYKYMYGDEITDSYEIYINNTFINTIIWMYENGYEDVVY